MGKARDIIKPNPPYIADSYDKLMLLAAEEVARQWGIGNVDTNTWTAALDMLTAAYFVRANASDARINQ